MLTGGITQKLIYIVYIYFKMVVTDNVDNIISNGVKSAI